MSALRFNLNVPEALVARHREWLVPGGLPRLAADVEAAGFDGVSVTDHPFPSSEWLAAGGHHALDPFVALSFLGAGSSSLRLLTNVLVLPYRHPVTTAKAIASLDALSGGRLTVGTAIGYLRPEFDALDADFAGRAATFERTIAKMRAAWATAEGGGERVMLPSPAQRPHPPIWIGGNSTAARRRAATFGNGWMPFAQSSASAAVTGTPALETADDLAAAVARLDEERLVADRADPLDVCFAPHRRSAVYRPDSSAAEVDDELAAYAGAGATWLSVQSRVKSPAELAGELERWAGAMVRHRDGS